MSEHNDIHNEPEGTQDESKLNDDTQDPQDSAEQESKDERAEQEAEEGHRRQEEAQAAVDDPIAILEREKLDLRNAYLRLSAETDNYRKRILSEKENFQKLALRGIMEKLLPVIDNLEMVV